MKRLTHLLLFVSFFLSCAAIAENNTDLLSLQKDWAVANYTLKGEAQEKAFDNLIIKADKTVGFNPASADALIWRGIIKSSFAGVNGGLGALSYIKEAKLDLEKSIEIDDRALSGSAHTSLGTLYFKAPGWPISFGDHELAKMHLKKALSLNPDGIDSNYFYASFLIDQNKEKQAKTYLLKAQQAPARPNRAVADSGRQQEINDLLQEMK